MTLSEVSELARIDSIGSEARRATAYLVGDDNEVIVIDPGEDTEAILSAVGDRAIVAVICTHAHPGHAAAALHIAERDDAPVALHPADLIGWRGVHPGGNPQIEMADGGIFEVAEVALEVLHTPGHTPGSVSLYCEDLAAVFAGDLVSADGPVPSSDGTSDFSRQVSSIGSELLTLPSGTQILPGHGLPFTVADAEKRFDTWLTGRE